MIIYESTVHWVGMSHQRPRDFDRRTVLKTVGATGALLGVGAVGSASASGDTEELIVNATDFAVMTDVEQRVADALSADVNIIKENKTLNYFKIEVETPDVGTMDDAKATIEGQGGVDTVDDVVTYEALGTNDPRFGDQYTPQQSNAVEAWETTEGEDALVAIVDTGADYEHENMVEQFDQNNPGRDFVDGNPAPMPVAPSENHGTHVAGICGSTSGNGIGTAGISNAQMISGRVLGASGGGSNDAIADGIQWAADEGADIINLSLGGPRPTRVIENAINYAFNNDTLPIAAAGNDGAPDSVGYPAAFENCLAVSAIDSNGNAANFTSRGPEVELTAGGAQVLAPVNNDQYDRLSGTSMSSPVVAGVAALAADAHGLTGQNRDAQELWNILTSTADDSLNLEPDVLGEGLVDAAAAVDGGEPGPGPDPEDPEAEITASETAPDVGDTVDLDGTASESPNGAITEYAWETETGSATGEQVTLQRDEEVAVDVTLTITDEVGETDSTSITIDFGGDGEPNEPSAVIDASDTEPDVGDTVDLDGSASESPNGAITEFFWETNEGTSATGEQVTLQRDEEVDVELTLTVTDETGETGSDSVTVSFGGEPDDPGEPECGDETNTETESDSLDGGWWGDDDNYTYMVSTPDPCEATVTLEADADFDLLVTTDVRTPTTWDYDAASTSSGTTEEVTVDLDDVENLGILVRASYFTSGEYELEIEEIGK